jgi:prepilin-type N-terminal cleavage/methylation domain-containing protein
MRQSIRSKSREGFSLVEVLVSVSLLSLVLMGLSGAAALGLAQMGKARQDLQYSADIQQVADSLLARSSINSFTRVTNGSTTIRGRAISWTTTDISATAQKISVVAQRRGLANASIMYADTLTVYTADPRRVQ